MALALKPKLHVQTARDSSMWPPTGWIGRPSLSTYRPLASWRATPALCTAMTCQSSLNTGAPLLPVAVSDT